MIGMYLLGVVVFSLYACCYVLMCLWFVILNFYTLLSSTSRWSALSEEGLETT